mgnify:CR=1 FL=1
MSEAEGFLPVCGCDGTHSKARRNPSVRLRRPPPFDKGGFFGSTPLYAALPPAYYSSSGWICTPRSAASNVSGRSVKSLFRLHGFL